jgi:hypothetical protein
MTYLCFKKELLTYLMQHRSAGSASVKVIEKGGFSKRWKQQNLIAHINFVESGINEQEATDDWFYFSEKEAETNDIKYWNVKECYRRYIAEGWQSILPMIEAQWGYGNTENKEEGNAFEACRKNLILKPFITGEHQQQLSRLIYWEFGEIALVLHRMIWNTEGERQTIPFNWDYMENSKINSSTLLGHALLNTSRIMPHRLFKAHSNGKWYLTTSWGLYGAVAIFYPNMQERLAKILGGDYYVDFYDMHRLLLCPVHRCKNLLTCAASGSSEQFLQGQPGYGKLYRYFQDRGKLVEV